MYTISNVIKVISEIGILWNADFFIFVQFLDLFGNIFVLNLANNSVGTEHELGYKKWLGFYLTTTPVLIMIWKRIEYFGNMY